MDASNSSPDQEREGEQQPSKLPFLCEKENLQEASDHAPMVSGTAQLPMLLLTIAALSFATGSGNMIYFGDRALSTLVESASRLRTRRSQVRLSSGSTHRTLSTPMGVMRVQAYRPEANRS